MNRINIYLDDACTIPIGNTLEEGKLYYVEFNFNSDLDRARFIIENNIKDIVEINPKNKIGTLKIKDRIGYIKFDDKIYDVRSKLFLSHHTGSQQLEILSNDIKRIANGLTFKFSGVTEQTSLINREDVNPTYFERFNYFRQLVFELPQGHDLKSLIAIIYKHPKQRICERLELTTINNIKITNPKTIYHLLNAKKYTTVHPYSELAKTHLAKKIFSFSGKSIFPYEFNANKIEFSIDNQENRFVKHFIQEICLISHYILNQKTKNSFINDSAKRMIDITETILVDNFFSKVGKIKSIPSSSTVLLGRNGYREIYQHFVNSRFGLVNILDQYERKNIHNTLKDISELYEIWAFYQIGSILFKDSIVLSKSQVIKGRNLSFGFSWENDNFKLVYNYVYTRESALSYSLTMRPDFTVIPKRLDTDLYYFLDAKYRGREKYIEVDNDIELLKYFNSEDIHKMHCYLDAIKNSSIAVIVYPGDIFRFYQKSYEKYNVKFNPKEIEELCGVGALPLVPGKNKDEFEDFLGLIQNGQL